MKAIKRELKVRKLQHGKVEIAHIVYIGSFSSEIFSAITGLIGTILGVLLTSKG